MLFLKQSLFVILPKNLEYTARKDLRNPPRLSHQEC